MAGKFEAFALLNEAIAFIVWIVGRPFSNHGNHVKSSTVSDDEDSDISTSSVDFVLSESSHCRTAVSWNFCIVLIVSFSKSKSVTVLVSVIKYKN